MELPNWLVPWWAWWADLTNLFNWDALGVLSLTIGGFWALWNWAASNMSSRRRDAAIIQCSLIPISAIVKSYKNVMNSIVADNDLKNHYISFYATNIFDHQSGYLKQIRSSGIPSVLAADIINASYAQILSMKYFVWSVISSDDEESNLVNIKNVYDCFCVLSAYAWQLEREVEKIGGVIRGYEVSSYDDILMNIKKYKNMGRVGRLMRRLSVLMPY